jgi:hypothetical protein
MWPLVRLLWDGIRSVRPGVPAADRFYRGQYMSRGAVERLRAAEGGLVCDTGFKVWRLERPEEWPRPTVVDGMKVEFEVEGLCLRRLLRRTPRGFVGTPGEGVLAPFTLLRVVDVLESGDAVEVRLSCVGRAYWLARRGSRACAIAADRAERLYAQAMGKLKGFGPRAPEGLAELHAAVDLGHVEAMVKLSVLCIGPGLADKTALGFGLLRAVANAGHSSGMNRLARYLHEGRFIERDLGAATMWFEKAARLGNTLAMRHLGVSMCEGLLGRVVRRAGRLWIEKAGERGNCSAMCYLAGLLGGLA